MVNKNQSNLEDGVEISQSLSAACLPTGRRNPKSRVLIVDDNPAKLTALTAALAGMDGIEIIAVASGTEALHKLLEQDFAVVLLDVNMPIMDGFETAELIRRRPRSEHLPILFITAERLADDARLKGYELGAVDYILSPVLPQILRSKVAVFADLYRLHEETARQSLIIANHNRILEEQVEARTAKLLDAQEELVRREKLSILGQVAGSVGHELRNPLGVMSNAVYFLQMVLPDADDIVKEYLGIIKDEIGNSERIVSDLLDSVRTKPPQPQAVGLAQLIDQTLGKLNVPPSVSVKLEIPDALPPLQVDPQQIRQVLRNLISNGVEAMPEGGTLEIFAVENKQDQTVTISVQDSGVGMTQEQLKKLFTPLITTKARRVGLGLVVVKNLTEANGGKVEVVSEAGKGSTFTVTLPCGGER